MFSGFSCARAGIASVILVPTFILVAGAGCSDPAPSEPTKRSQPASRRWAAGRPMHRRASSAVRRSRSGTTRARIMRSSPTRTTERPRCRSCSCSTGAAETAPASAAPTTSRARRRGRPSSSIRTPTERAGRGILERDAENNIDILTFDAILETLSGSHCINRKRVFATGYSAGGYFSNQLACRRGSVLRAIASHAGGGPFGQNVEYGDDGKLRCPERPIAALIAHGTDDTTVKLEEAQQSREHWRRVNACASGGGTPRDPAPCVSLASCAEDCPVVYCDIPGLGHSVWPEKGAKVTWDFFASF